jgi:hypothetical protein
MEPVWETKSIPLEVATFHAYDQNEVKVYSKAFDYNSILYDIKEELRGFLKYGHNFKSAEEVLQWYYDQASDWNIEN